jgi:hypothetical protein
VEVTCRGDPGANFMVSTMRIFNFPAQGIHTLTKTLLLKRLHSFEKDKRHIRCRFDKSFGTEIYGQNLKTGNKKLVKK